MIDVTYKPEGGFTITESYYDLESTIKEIFPINYTKDSEASYLSRVKMVSDLITYCAKQAIEKELQ